MPMLEEKTRVDGYPQKQRKQMYLALGLLVTALIVVVVKDRNFWMGTTPAAEEVAPNDAAAEPNSPEQATPDQSGAGQASSTQTVTPSSVPAHPAKQKSHESHPAHSKAPMAAIPSVATTERTAIPPLEIEVVAGDQHRPVQTVNPSMRVDLQNGSAPAPAATVTAAPPQNLATNAGERVRLSADTAQMVEHPVEPSYPMLAKQMKVQGSVVLQALIGREGGIQDLRVLSGPAILSTAAMDAVKQWRFRPYLQSGQPIETEARITVNFTISTY